MQTGNWLTCEKIYVILSDPGIKQCVSHMQTGDWLE